MREFTEAIRPRLRIFFSADLVGSTQFKQSKSSINTDESSEEGWGEEILKFYSKFPSALYSERQGYLEKLESEGTTEFKDAGIPKIEFWKGKGDELLFTSELAHQFQAAMLIVIWKQTLEIYGKELHKRLPQLHIKSAAWTAGFPIKNWEVVFESGGGSVYKKYEHSQEVHQFAMRKIWYDNSSGGPSENAHSLIRDFIGPSIDIGFRLTQICEPGKLVVSVELAYLLTNDGTSIMRKHKLAIYYEGNHPLKGVIGGKPYPVFWVNVESNSELDRLEDQLSKRKKCSPTDVADFCEKFISQNQVYLALPFIVDKGKIVYGSLPDKYFEKLHEIQSRCESEVLKADATSRNVSDGIQVGQPEEEESGDSKHKLAELVQHFPDQTSSNSGTSSKDT